MEPKPKLSEMLGVESTPEENLQITKEQLKKEFDDLYKDLQEKRAWLQNPGASLDMESFLGDIMGKVSSIKAKLEK